MAMTQLNNNDLTSIETGKDSIVIVDNGYSIRGGRSLNVVGYAPRVIRAGHVIIHETATNEYKPMPVTEGNTSGVATFGTVTAGTGYTNGTYENVPLYNISGSNTGTGVLATVVVAGGVVTTVTKTNGGNYYAAADVLGVNPAYVGGTGSGFSIPVATVSDVAGAYGALPAGHTYAGIQIQSVLKEKAMVGILIHGVVNPAAAPYSMTSILAAVKTALPQIIFRED
jgi:hypothetical protein